MYTHVYIDTYYVPASCRYASESFDLVVALMSLHHIPKVSAMVKDIKRVLKPGGRLVYREHDNNKDGSLSMGM